VRGVLHDNLRQPTKKSKARKPKPAGCTALDSRQNLERLLEVDQPHWHAPQ